MSSNECGAPQKQEEPTKKDCSNNKDCYECMNHGCSPISPSWCVGNQSCSGDCDECLEVFIRTCSLDKVQEAHDQMAGRNGWQPWSSNALPSWKEIIETAMLVTGADLFEAEMAAMRFKQEIEAGAVG
ncbi:MAG: hypothetical protein WCE94_08700 [Candidatus Methanoperedens sp.]